MSHENQCDLSNESLRSLVYYGGQTRISVLSELMSKSLYNNYSTLVSRSDKDKSCKEVDQRGSLLNSHVLVKQEQQLHDSLQNESFLNSHVLAKKTNKQGQELHRSRQARVFLTLMSWSDKNNSCMEVGKPEFSQLSCPGQAKANKSCKRVEARVGMNVF